MVRERRTFSNSLTISGIFTEATLPVDIIRTCNAFGMLLAAAVKVIEDIVVEITNSNLAKHSVTQCVSVRVTRGFAAATSWRCRLGRRR